MKRPFPIVNQKSLIVNGETVRAETRYYPWGQDNRWKVNVTPTGARFTNQRLDDTLNLYNYNARYYDHWIGRFITADTIVPKPATPQSLNRYSYTRNNPVNLIDPSGHSEHKTKKDRSNTATSDTTTTSANGVSNAYTSAFGVWDIFNGGRLARHGFEIVEGSSYAGQYIIFGSHRASRIAGISPYLRHASGQHGAIRGFINPGSAARSAAWGKVSKGTIVLTVLANIIDFGWGSNAQEGVVSTKFVATNAVDLTSGLGLPAAGAAAGTALLPGVGTLIGGGAGALLDIFFKTYKGGKYRNDAVEITDAILQLAVDGANHFFDTVSNSTGALSLYPMPLYEEGAIQTTYPINGTVGINP